jgi:hypothetical protein
MRAWVKVLLEMGVATGCAPVEARHEARLWLEKAAHQGSASAQINLARLLLEVIFLGRKKNTHARMGDRRESRTAFMNERGSGGTRREHKEGGLGGGDWRDERGLERRMSSL